MGLTKRPPLWLDMLMLIRAAMKVDRRSTCGYVFYHGGGPISWKTRKQTPVAISTVKAEYLSATEATKQALRHRILLALPLS